MDQLTKQDLNFVVSRIPTDVRTLMKSYPSLMIGGGFVRGTVAREKISDIDIFGPDEHTLKLAAQEIALKRKGRIYETKNALTVLAPPRLPLQFIKRWTYNTPSALIESFDYTVCQAAISIAVATPPPVPADVEASASVTWYGHCSPMFYPDLAARRLNYTCPVRNEDAGGSMLRMRKFIERGYTIQAGSMARVIARLVVGIDFNKLSAMASGNEKEIANMITNLLREVDPLRMIDGLELVDEHEIEGI